MRESNTRGATHVSSFLAFKRRDNKQSGHNGRTPASVEAAVTFNIARMQLDKVANIEEDKS